MIPKTETRFTSIKAAAAALTISALAACGGGGAGESGENIAQQNSAEALRSAAEQSTPEAREVLLNQAEQLEGQNVQAPIGAPGSPVQQAMNRAGDAQAPQAPPPLQAQPHRPGDPVPPPKTMPPQ